MLGLVEVSLGGVIGVEYGHRVIDVKLYALHLSKHVTLILYFKKLGKLECIVSHGVLHC